MTPVLHDSNEWKTLLADVRSLQDGQRNLEAQMITLLGVNGNGQNGLIGTLVTAVDKLDQTVAGMNKTITGWQAVLADRKDRNTLWFPIIATLLAALIALLATMWVTRSGRAALSLNDDGKALAQDAGGPRYY